MVGKRSTQVPQRCIVQMQFLLFASTSRGPKSGRNVLTSSWTKHCFRTNMCVNAIFYHSTVYLRGCLTPNPEGWMSSAKEVYTESKNSPQKKHMTPTKETKAMTWKLIIRNSQEAARKNTRGRDAVCFHELYHACEWAVIKADGIYEPRRCARKPWRNTQYPTSLSGFTNS